MIQIGKNKLDELGLAAAIVVPTITFVLGMSGGIIVKSIKDKLFGTQFAGEIDQAKYFAQISES